MSQCSGCGLCAFVCKHNAITMERAEDGFLYPKIDPRRCVNCGICKTVCPFAQHTEAGNLPLAAYGFKHNRAIREQSSSGGFFTALSDCILAQGGVVYGAVWTKEFAVTHIRGETADQRNQMRSSKYIQSDITAVFADIKADVSSGMPVLFTGTPCQCAAVCKLFNGQPPENLYIMDLICHGVMPQPFFDAYIKDICQRNGQQIAQVNLRDKRFGLETVGITFADGTVYHSKNDYFYKAYGVHALQRPSCFSCTCAKQRRYSDFTAGDFWGIQKSHPDFHDDLGVSLLLVNTPKGQSLYQQLGGSTDAIAVSPETYAPYQPNLSVPTQQGKNANRFLNYYRKHGYKKTMHRFFDVTLARRMNAFVYKSLKTILHK